MTKPEEFLSTGEFCKRLKRSRTGVRKLVAQGVIPPAVVVTGSGRWIWRAADVEVVQETLRNRRSATEAVAHEVAA